MTFPLLTLDPKFIFELAAGLEEPDHIAKKYHYTDEAWSALSQDENFRKVVDSKRHELQKSGYTFRLKAALAAEDLLDEVYVGAKSPDASLSAKLESFKYLTKIAGLEPKEDKGVVAGPGFSIKIELGDNSITINQNPQDAMKTIDIIPEDDLPEAPTHLLNLFPITDDLHATDLQTA
jgi:hypothetical protein